MSLEKAARGCLQPSLTLGDLIVLPQLLDTDDFRQTVLLWLSEQKTAGR
jgi:hypothetical protein